MDEEAMKSRRDARYVLGMCPEYDASRATYALTRRTDPSIAAAIERALGDARTVVNVGAGAGSYESPAREIVAVEPSEVMRAQRPAGSARVIAARAEQLPLADDSVDAALAVLTVHHWDDQLRGLAEMRRVASRRVVVFTYDADQADALWLVRDYLPEIAVLDRDRFLPLDDLVEALGGAHVARVPIPHDCRDGMLGAFWRRPERYLDPALPAGNSGLGDIDPGALERGLAKLRNDLDSGAWRRNYGGLLSRDELDVGYRLLVAEL
jgi:SAM-dependent methyltransferase